MSIKDFFKPTKLKIIIFIIIAVLAFTVGLDKEPVGVGEPKLPNLQYVAPECETYVNLLLGFWPFSEKVCINMDGFPLLAIPSVIADYADYFDYLSNFTGFFQITSILVFSILFILFSMIYWYLLSCLMVSIYKKIRKNHIFNQRS
ncbi:MAG: hypothetical protein COX44_00670 [Candidatus Portnoybacteria bacterium CG23_combo_of_CG06-09_8_20_14_all_37_13]|uniref:Uncharacterized protein n=1 Tax=Candidatus Portnoybacteria bacterium CG23_combo_of_CG06-09_8_20_14_all_37_13 TaxID=1974819 RepID=A0A2G9YDJ6_9BACT|nr:MAG: hypothetical protein COX44_00670 [Candidatus Portnoybacteria bacterium CG23_combo_of_CG06-09_8_20_14_all_37_13]